MWIKKIFSCLSFLFTLFVGYQNSLSIPPTNPMKVELKIETPCILYGTAKITCVISSILDAPKTTARLSLPSGLKLKSGNLEWEGDVLKDNPVSFCVEVMAESVGLWEIQVEAYSTLDSLCSLGDEDNVFLQVETLTGKILKERNIISEKGPSAPSKQIESQQVKEIKTYPQGNCPGILPSSKQISDDTSEGKGTLVTITIIGRLLYHHPWDSAGVYRPVINASVYAYDHDDFSADDYLGGVASGWDGTFTIGPVSNSDGEGGTQDVYLEFWLWNTRWRVLTYTAEVYWWYTDRMNNVPDGIVNFGDRVIDGTPYVNAVCIFASMNFGWNFATVCGHDPGDIWAVWPSGDTYEDNYVIYIAGSDNARSQDVVLHEYGHAMMERAYEGWWPPNATGSHYINKISNQNMAWTEGFADFYPIAVYNDGDFNWTPNSGWPIESEAWVSGDTGCDELLASC